METRTYGKQVVTIEGDVVHLRWVGEFTAAELTGVLDDLYRMAEGRKEPVFFVVDMAQGTSVPYDARRALVRYNERKPYGDTVLYNATFITKVLARLMSNATNLLRPSAARQEMVFVESEEEARAWVARRRQELRGG